MDWDEEQRRFVICLIKNIHLLGIEIDEYFQVLDFEDITWKQKTREAKNSNG